MSAPHMIVDESGMTRVDSIRNVAIIAHVDHGKTTLVDAMLRQAGAFREGAQLTDRIMDSTDLEREKGITIQAKNTAVRFTRPDGSVVKINVVDTPGHADFGGEVERGLTMVDGVILLVDASEGPLPQTRFVLRKAMALDLPVILIINKIDRADARIAEVIDEVYELFLDLDAHDHQIEFPIVYCVARDGTATLDLDEPGTSLAPLFETILTTIPAPLTDPLHPFQARVTNLDASSYVGRLALCRVMHGEVKRGQQVAWCRLDGTIERAKIGVIYSTENHERVEVDSVGAGEIAAISGIEEITIGETLADLDDPRPLEVIVIDEPSLSMTIGTNSSPVAGVDGDKLTARQVKTRLDAELVGNVSIRVNPTERPDTWEVMARGELQLAVLVEMMRREGFELTIGKPRVVTTMINDVKHEPVERLSVDVPEEHMGAVQALLAPRRGRLETMSNHGTGWVRLEFLVPARGLLGFRTQFLTETRGTGIMSHSFETMEPWAGEVRPRDRGSLVADRRGMTTAYAITSIQERSTLFLPPGTDVYEGMIVGENSRVEDMDVNICREKKLTNMRTSSSDNTVPLTPPRLLSLEQALEFIAEDECVEVTPATVRLRKVVLDQTDRAKITKQAKQAKV